MKFLIVHDDLIMNIFSDCYACKSMLIININILEKKEKERNMKKLLSIATALTLIIGLTACGGASSATETSTAETTAIETTATETSSMAATTEAATTETSDQTEVIVFAAASMTETLQEIAEKYKEVAPDVKLTFNFDSSGTLKTQIQEGAECDLFISAGQKQMNQLDKTSDPSINTENLDFVDDTTRINILENKVALVVPKANPKKIDSFDTLSELLKSGEVLMSMGNSDVPVGQYTQKILAFYKLDEAALASAGKITYGTNVKEVTTQVNEGSVDCGVIYSTDAFSAGLDVIDTATKEMCGQVIYPAALLKNALHADAAKAFLDYLTSDDAMSVFTNVGFSAVK